MEKGPRISVVVGVQDGAANVPEILNVLDAAAFRDFEVIICHGLDDPVSLPAETVCSIATVQGPAGALIPMLWAAGIKASRGNTVAILTAHCIPTAGWLDHVAHLDMIKCVAYGGLIELSPIADAKDGAIHILRYASVTPPQTRRAVHDVAADNAVYRRKDIMDCTDLLEAGFWEPSFHQRFRENGQRLELDSGMVVRHVNRYTARAFMQQRYAHGCVFAGDRAKGQPLIRRIGLLLAAPMAYAVFLTKLAFRAYRAPALRPRLLSSALWLSVFTASWIAGEAKGYLRSVVAPRSPKA